MKAYLSGPIENAENDGASWRQDMTFWLKDNLNHEVFNPVLETKSIIEHLNPKQSLFFLKECYRILKKGGIMRMVTPDFENQVIEYISPCIFFLNFVLKKGISLNTCLSEPFLAKSLMLLLFVALSI